MSATQGPSGAARIEDTVKDFWATRPRRPRRGRKIAGVAAGIGNRYRIDPVLVRVGLAVAAIWGGAGVLIYLLGWLFLPEENDEAAPIEALFGKGRSSTSSAFTVLLGIITVPAVGWFFSGSFTGEFSSWMSMLVAGGLLFMLHQSRGNMTPITSTPAAPTPPPAPTTPIAMPTMPMATPAGPATSPVAAPPPEAQHAEEQPRTTPPAWDPLGAAPFAWDLPEPTPPEPEEPEPPVKRRKPRVATATLGITLVTVAVLSIVATSSPAIGWINPPHVIGVALAIIGLGLVAGAFLRAGRGLIALAVPLSVAGLAATAVGPGGYHGFGDLAALPISTDAVQATYERTAGDIEVDLSRLPNTDEVDTRVHTDAGNVVVIVPQDADVTFTCETKAGELQCLDEPRMSGANLAVPGAVSYGADGPGGLRIELEASAGYGNVEVRRG